MRVVFPTILFVATCFVGGSWAANCTGDMVKCKDGLIVPMWRPTENLGIGDKIGRAIIYFLALGYLFLGVSVLADRFMAAIEVITSQERVIHVTKPTGEKYSFTMKVWNETVSNLTLMALGSSAPEILLSIIEVCGNHFEAGELGPNTIVGSAAFNLFMIIAICVYVIPSPQVRRQKHLRVFIITASWSVFAYVWLYLILAVITPNQVDWWEGLLTFLFFPLTVLMAWVADRQLLFYKYISKQYRRDRRGVLVGAEKTGENSALEMGARRSSMNKDVLHVGDGSADQQLLPSGDLVAGTCARQADPAMAEYERHRQQYLDILRELRKKHPNSDLAALQQMAEYEMLSRAKKSRAFYRVAATRKMMGGGGNIVKKKLDKVLPNKRKTEAEIEEELARKRTCRVFFNPGHYTVLENVGTFTANVAREGGPDDLTIMVDYRTEDGTANANSDYMPSQGTLTFTPNILQLQIPVEIIDDDVFEEDEHFNILLENLRVKTKDGLVIDPSKLGSPPLAQLVAPYSAMCMILDDDHAGVFSLENREYVVSENDGYLHVKVMRSSGARGRVVVPYRTVNGTAVGERDFEKKEGELIFENDEVEQIITIGIVNDEEYEKSETFFIELEPPIWAKKLSDTTRLIERYKRKQRRKLEQGGGKKARPLRPLLDLIAKDKDGADGSIDSGRLSPIAGQGEGEENIADLGKPKLGDVAKCSVKIKESHEFKGVVDRMIKTANLSLVVGTSSWREQFIEALTVSAGAEDEARDEEEVAAEADGVEKEEKLPSCGDYVMHFLSVPWKVLCAFIPPTEYLNGWACFVVSIAMIGLFTAVIGDLANHFGCSIGLKDAVTAISFVAMGTSVPDTFASKVSAVQDKYADGSIGNVTGSNGVNVFLGIGIAWTIAAIYHNAQGNIFYVSAGTLAFSVTIFCVEATVAIIFILLRRLKCVGGELGGPYPAKVATTGFFVFLWLLYLVLSSLEAYCVIEGF